jgi:hypothetical protein
MEFASNYFRMRIVSALPALAAVETSYEVGHGFVGAPRLHLVEMSFLAAALEAGEESLLVTRLSLFLRPICSSGCEVSLLNFLSLYLQRF